ncbi:hypothetical protein ACPA9J_15950 [Pseudomonas aeruginosa]
MRLRCAPLLRNNAEGFKTFGDAAQAAGAILDEKTIKSANELQAATWLVEQSASGLKNQLSTALILILSDLADSVFDVTKEGTAMVSVGEFVADSFRWIARDSNWRCRSVRAGGEIDCWRRSNGQELVLME